MNKFMEMVRSLTEEEKVEFKAILGLNVVKATRVQVGGKLLRTEKVLETKIARQMQQLIDALPADRAIDVAEWTKIALENGLQTQQDPVRITLYYKKQILDSGYAVVSQ